MENSQILAGTETDSNYELYYSSSKDVLSLQVNDQLPSAQAGCDDEWQQFGWSSSAIAFDPNVQPPIFEITKLDCLEKFPAVGMTRDESHCAENKNVPGEVGGNLGERTHRRRKQNRAAQKAFRMRKEDKLRQLESRIAELQKRLSTSDSREQELEAALIAARKVIDALEATLLERPLTAAAGVVDVLNSALANGQIPAAVDKDDKPNSLEGTTTESASSTIDGRLRVVPDRETPTFILKVDLGRFCKIE